MAMQLRYSQPRCIKILHIFHRFLRSQTERSACTSLSIIRELADRHGLSSIFLCERTQTVVQDIQQPIASCRHGFQFSGKGKHKIHEFQFASPEISCGKYAGEKQPEKCHSAHEEREESHSSTTLLDSRQSVRQYALPYSYTNDDMLAGNIAYNDCVREFISLSPVMTKYINEYLKSLSDNEAYTMNNISHHPERLTQCSIGQNVEVTDVQFVQFCDTSEEGFGMIKQTNVDLQELHSVTPETSYHWYCNTGSAQQTCNTSESLSNSGLINSCSSPNVVYFSRTSHMCTSNESKKQDESAKPTSDQLLQAKDNLAEHLPQVFKKVHNYTMYTKDVILENNYVTNPYVKIGINAYATALIKTRCWIHFKYANVRVFLLSGSHDQDEGNVTFRWRVSGLPNSQAFMFWKFFPWNYRKSLDENSVWYDGISTFYINGSGKIYKHRIDRMEKDEQKEPVKAPVGVLGKLAMAVGLQSKVVSKNMQCT